MAKRTSSLWPISIAVLGMLIVVVVLPEQWKALWAPAFLRPGFHLGLDLAGGTQLDFRISESEIDEQLRTIDTELQSVKEQNGSSERIAELEIEKQVIELQRQNLVEAIRTVLERRINALGVSEATITPSYIGNEKHLLVECPGVVDVQKCIETVGKTIQLEFKEEFTEATDEFEASVRAKAADAMRRITISGATLVTLGQDLGDDLGVGYDEGRWYFKDQLPKGLESLWQRKPGDTVAQLEGSITVPTQAADGSVTSEEIEGIFLAESLSPRTQTGRVLEEAEKAFALLAERNPGSRTDLQENLALDAPLSPLLAEGISGMQQGDLKVIATSSSAAQLIFLRQFTPGKRVVDMSHIVVAFSGATNAPATVTRSKDQAMVKAAELKDKLTAGASLEDLARTDSDSQSASNGGKLTAISANDLVPALSGIAFSQQAGVISEPVESPFGYHIIRVEKAPYDLPATASFDQLTFTGTGAEAAANAALEDLQQGKVTRMEEAIRLRTLFFSLKPTGWKDTPLDGKHFRSAAVSLDPTTNIPVVQIIFDEEGGTIFQELTKRNIGKRIAIFVGGELVSAPTVQTEIIGGTAVITGSSTVQEAQALAQDLNTGAIPAPIYLSGQRTVEATLGAEALRTSVLAGFFGMLIVMLYMLIVYRFLGLIANIALLIYAVIFIAILKLPLFLVTDQYIVLTLAGAAGMILSIGMAVDTNVLVFERVKEELKKGKSLASAVDIGFDKAWSSIRDSNISTIITCALLFIIGTSIVRGFAITLGMGVLISMFTGMIVARWMTEQVARSPLAKATSLFPGSKRSA